MTAADRPVWDGYCADPFVLPHADGYTMYGTTPHRLDGRAFQTLHSRDLLTWRDGGGALQVPPDVAPGTEYWAPEVTVRDGRLWMYYSSGIGDSGHHLRVATATGPGAAFTDTGVDLTPELPFAIDPSPLRDDGRWWLYFATDRIDGARPGTVIAVAPLDTPTSLGAHQILLTASADWQRYQADRELYGRRLDWHTLEGPTVIRRGPTYWMTYAGGNWQNAGYGAAVAAAPHPQGPWTESEPRASFLSQDTIGLIGPGHNSLFTGHDGRTYTVFHAWDDQLTRRRPYIRRVNWTDAGPSLATEPDA